MPTYLSYLMIVMAGIKCVGEHMQCRERREEENTLQPQKEENWQPSEEIFPLKLPLQRKGRPAMHLYG